MKKTFIPAILVVVLGTASCKKDFLDRYPQTSISADLFFKSEQDLSLYVNGLLSMPGTGEFLNDQNSDNTATTGAVEIKNIMTGTPSSQTITSGWSWGRLRNINYFLDNYQQAAVSDEVKNHYAGLARYYRAQFYMGMVRRYSDLPWYGKTINPGDSAELYKARNPRAVVVDSIMADLEFAAAHVRDEVPTGTPDVWAVKAFQARAALYEGTYRRYHEELNLQTTSDAFLQKAVDVSNEIMQSGKFQLHSTGKVNQDYADLFRSADLLGNKEVILANPFDATKPGAPGSSVNGIVFGDYEQSPSRDLVQTYLMKDGSRFTSNPAYQSMQYVQEFSDRDPRMKQTLVYPGFVRTPETKPYVQRLNKNFTGYHQLKGYINGTTDNVVMNSVDFPVYRFAEVLLNFAEAKAELGTLTQADLENSVNLLRSRAGMPALDLAAANGDPDPVLASKYPNVTGAMQGVLLEIRRERRVELALEGYRFDDLMRWHAGLLLERIPEGMYFPGLGKYDLTGDGNEDIILIGENETIPAENQKESNALGEKLIYYKAGSFGDNVTVFLRNGAGGGTLVTEMTPRSFIEPKYYYRPVPYGQVVLNPNLSQIFGWQ
ncbi:RagB/SusD family nutrient uptake outer membrane protein [Flavihumibacter solisilvae]|uniref:Membrane protein n=1 Tax=Flavihumibacter solisilvae TaxID=1349421 RepID=A0A0C1IIM8_9BACT|nr:RagB/SusD family nutrient uptake outer membrane protein [Flavihumibacter solisilvae]KIC94025.1 membrane protein [Flavihumibacter solisilvae]